MMLSQPWGKSVLMAMYAPGQLAAAVYQVHALCQVFYQAQCWLRSTGLAKHLAFVWGKLPVFRKPYHHSGKMLSTTTAGCWEDSQQGVWPGLLSVVNCWTWPRAQASRWGLELLKAACGPTCKGRPEEASACSGIAWGFLWFEEFQDRDFLLHLLAFPPLTSWSWRNIFYLVSLQDVSSISVVLKLANATIL